MKHIMIILGTRPEAIKLAPLILALQKEQNIRLSICVTGQHKQMLNQVLELFDIQPDIDLAIMHDGQDLTDILTKILLQLRSIFAKHSPDMIIVHGDTSTTMSASIASFYANIPIAHIEAGLRSFNINSPWPEEFNRRVTGLLSHLHFAPTKSAQNNLLSEGVRAESICVTGNTVIDALFAILQKLESDRERRYQVDAALSKHLGFDYSQHTFVLITGHRRENFNGGFEEICKAIHYLAKRYPQVYFVYPVHLNPHVQKVVYPLLSELSNSKLLDPLNYEEFVWLLKHCYLVLTDSGGIQEEAPSLGKPVLVMREVTERPEAIAAGTVELVGTDFKKITSKVSQLIDDSEMYSTMSKAINPYGDGRAVERIVAELRRFWKQ